MKYFLPLLFIAVIILLAVGFYIKPEDEATGHLLIGSAIVVGFFILMPSFIYHRWKDKNVKDYMLTKENIEKMQEYQKDKKL
ncbi:hypothetical protein [Ulvibacter litoralis]|uniref:Uncharacterized protein n=1 Tax=Ulvibacter litoralis TaxID=227084 RepID=A0A1G7DPZ5_9FLAO|nr:hypothetical protein [Ulvibacter litoralis]GHC42846.1 hypothetical protein GCM10008083_01320 [Ulvibacter litoralis]SDE52915.1 hypothetical protein SAMN05421855_1011079 [Ulvibacter litoralis]